MEEQGAGAANDQYRRLVETSPDGILIARDARIEFLNPAAARLFGASDLSQILGKSLFDFFHRDSHSNIQCCLDRLLRGECPPPDEVNLVQLDSSERSVEIHSTRFTDGDGRAVQMIVRDISSRKRLESRLRENEERLRLAFAGAQE